MKRTQLLALHGFTGCGADFVPLQRRLGGPHEIFNAPLSWQCPDLPGHASSRHLACTPEATLQFIQDLALTAKANLPTASKILLGYSMGARAALLHATTYPNFWDALILISPNPGIEKESDRKTRKAADQQLAEQIEHQDLETFLKFWQNQPLIQSQQNMSESSHEAMQANRLRHHSDGLANSVRDFGQGNFPNLWPNLSNLKMPVLLLTGERDLKYSSIAQRIASDFIPQAEYISIPAVGHAPHFEAPNLTGQQIHKFLTRLTE